MRETRQIVCLFFTNCKVIAMLVRNKVKLFTIVAVQIARSSPITFLGSLMQIMKRSGPKMDPLGTLALVIIVSNTI